ncbi:MAG: bifunctional histidinol-phosphatase/imidazoleglycerol-phosphate dehydratase HisB [Bacteroidota bacterium]
MKKVFFIDRDGVLIKEPEDYQIDSFEKLVFMPKMILSLAKIAKELDYTLVMITNQDGLGTDSFPEKTFWPVHNFLIETLKGEGILFENIFIDRTFAHENADTRKPKTGLLTDYFNGDYDLANSYVIGDRLSDIILAQNLGANGILIRDGAMDYNELDKQWNNQLTADFSKVKSWEEVYDVLKPSRKGTVHRVTKETDIKILLDLDGDRNAKISTGLGFFDHMLEQLPMHGFFKLEVETKGDLHIDEHHTIEDTALALGEAFNLALGNKKGIERYGFTLPMDDVIATVAIDFSGRNWLNWNVEFKREKIGDMPTEMFYHFFKSFTDTAKCNLYIHAEGNNEHHKIEGIFKAFARSIKQGIQKSNSNEIPSTKGIL